MIEKLFYETLIKKCNINKESKILLAISGGMDSMVMLHLFIKYSKKLKLKLSLIHLNHKLQENSNFICDFVIKNANKMKIPYYTKEVLIKKKSKEFKISLEMSGRIERYKFFNFIKKKINYDFIATAHHLKDQIETVLINLIRGTGLKGLKGIEYKNKNIIRPMLSISKKDIIYYSKLNNINYIEDKSNFDNKFLRNRIRNELIPMLETFNPKIKDKIFSLTEIAKESDNFLEKKINKYYEKYIHNYNNKEFFIDSNFKKNDVIIRKRILQIVFKELTGKSLEYINVNKFDKGLFEKEKRKKLSLPCNVFLKKEKNGFFLKQNIKDFKNIKKNYSFFVYNIGKYELPNNFGKITIKIINNKNEYKNANKNEAYLQLNKIDFPLIIRNRLKGDFFNPFGFYKKVKLKKWFINKKIAKEERNFLPLILNKKKEILFIPKLGISEIAKIENNKLNSKNKILYIFYEK